MENQIVLKQAPVIVHKLQEVGAEVTRRIEELDIDSLVATEDSLKSLKSTRAELNKELKEFEDQRKFIKNGVAKPYQDFEAIYKEEISGKYTYAVEKLKKKIETIEMKLKEEKRDQIVEYFLELRAAEKIDFIEFDHTGIEVNLSTSLKAYKEKAEEFVSRIKDDVSLIETMEHQAEIFAEYKRTLNASQAIKEINNRKQREEEEKERIRLAGIQKRKNRLQALGMKFDEFSNSYMYDSLFFVTLKEVEDLSDKEFEVRIIELQAELAEYNEAKKKPESGKEYNVAYVATPPKKEEPLQAPVVEEKEKTFTASFEVTGTMTQMQALKAFLIENKITYKNL